MSKEYRLEVGKTGFNHHIDIYYDAEEAQAAITHLKLHRDEKGGYAKLYYNEMIVGMEGEYYVNS